MDDGILKIEGLNYTYDDGTRALKDINFHVNRGEMLAVMGSNGSGKSTLFLCLNGVHKAESGQILLNGQKVGYKKRELLHLRSKVGIVFQDPDSQLFCADIYGEISFGPMNLGYSKAETECKVNRVIEQLDLGEFLEKPTHHLSGGQKKQVSIADIVAMEPEVIILDEPCAALDPVHTKMVYEIMEELNKQGITVIFSTHNTNAAFEWADRVIVMHQGEIVAADSCEAIFKDDLLLSKTHLEKPFVLQVYESFIDTFECEQGEMPHNIEELKRCMESLKKVE